MDGNTVRLLVIVAIFLGVLLRTGAPYLRKKKLSDLLQIEMTWIYTAITAFGASWVSVIIVIPVDADPLIQVLFAFFIAFGENSILNEAAKWKQQYQYIKNGTLPPR